MSSPAEIRTSEILEQLAVLDIEAEGNVSGDWTHLRIPPEDADRLLRFLFSADNDGEDSRTYRVLSEREMRGLPG